MLIYGAGGHAAVVRSIVLSCGNDITAVFDDDQALRFLMDIPVLHSYNASLFEGEHLIIAIGENAARRKVAEKIGHPFGKAIHPTALVDNTADISLGCVIMHRVIVQARTILGEHCIVNTGAIIEHDCKLGNFVHVAPGTILCGSVHVGDGTLIGAGCIINPGIRIGANCTIGSGSIVTRDIPDNATAYGQPARIQHY